MVLFRKGPFVLALLACAAAWIATSERGRDAIQKLLTPAAPRVEDVVTATPGTEAWTGETEIVGAGMLRQSVRQEGHVRTWYVESRCTAPVTLSPTITVENMTVAPHAPIQVVPAGKTVRVMRYEVADPERPYKNNIGLSAQIGDFRAAPKQYAYRLPWSSRREVPISQGWHGAFSHHGEGEYAVDLIMPEGEEVRAARDGTVIALNATATGGGTTPEYQDRKLANFVFVQHEDGTYGKYWHLAPGGVLVKAGQAVRRGDLLGRSGNTGMSSTPHLHFEVGAPVDGTRSRTFPFRWRVAAGRPPEEPVEGRRYRSD